MHIESSHQYRLESCKTAFNNSEGSLKISRGRTRSFGDRLPELKSDSSGQGAARYHVKATKSNLLQAKVCKYVRLGGLEPSGGLDGSNYGHIRRAPQ